MPARRHLMGRGVAEETRASTGSGQFWGARAVPSRTTGGSGVLTGIWLSTGQVQMPIETLLLEMLEPTQPLRRSECEERRGREKPAGGDPSRGKGAQRHHESFGARGIAEVGSLSS